MTIYNDREHCYRCYRPLKGCICHTIAKVQTQSCFVLLMHPKEFKKTKNGTGHMTHLTLPHSHLFVGIDFTHHKRLNALLDDSAYTPFLLYPSSDAINISTQSLLLDESKKALFILIDSTWACSKKMIRSSKNVDALPKISFDTTTLSQFSIKEQPKDYCLSTIETAEKIVRLLDVQGVESISNEAMNTILDPFYSMIEYQVDAARQAKVRFRPSEKC